MGKERVFRKLTKQRTASVGAKNTLMGLVSLVKEQCEISWPEARVLGSTLYEHFVGLGDGQKEGQIVYGARYRPDMMARSIPPLAEPFPIKLTIYSPYDVELWHDTGGIKAVKAARLVRWVDEAWRQGALLGAYDLALLSGMSAKAARETLKPFWSKGVMLPTNGMTKAWFEGLKHGWAEMAVARYLAGEKEDSFCQDLLISRSHWDCIYRTAKTEILSGKEGGFRHLWEISDNEQRKEQLAFPADRLRPVVPTTLAELEVDLRKRFGLSEVGTELLLQRVEEWLKPVQTEAREPGQIVYHAVASDEPPSKPLSECTLVPVVLDYLTEDDSRDFCIDAPRDLVWNRVERLSKQAFEQGACLNQPDLALMLGVTPDRIQDLCKKHSEVLIPTRGNVIDMGPGVTHVRRIVELYLQGYTESDIERRTYHSLISIENYLDRFRKVVGLLDDGLTTTEIRMVLGCAMRTAREYVELVKEYDTKEHRWMMAMIRRHYEKAKKDPEWEGSGSLGRRRGSSTPFASLEERSVEGLQLQFLRRRLELAEKSLVGEKLLESFGVTMDEYEAKEGIRRVGPGQLLVECERQIIVVPLWHPPGISNLAKGGSLSDYFQQVSMEQYVMLKEACPQVDSSCLWSLLLRPPACQLSRDSVAAWGDGIERTEALSRLSLPSPEAVGARTEVRELLDSVPTPKPVVDKLLDELSNGLGLRDGFLTAAFDSLGAIRNWLRPEQSELEPGQVLWLGYSTDRSRYWRQRNEGIRYRPVVLTHHTPAEVGKDGLSKVALLELELARVGRLTTEAWVQGAALTNTDLALLLHRSPYQIRTLLDMYQQRHNVLLPTAGTVLDMGSTTTHKLLAVEMSLRQMNTTEISRRIFHDPRSVDNYLSNFNKVAMLYVLGFPRRSIAWLLSCSERLVGEYLSLAEAHFPDRQKLIGHLEESGIKIS